MGEYVIYGNSTIVGSEAGSDNVFKAETVLDLTPVKKIAVLAKLKMNAVIQETRTLISSGLGYNSGLNNFRIQTNSVGQLRMGSRTGSSQMNVTAATSAESTQINTLVNVTDLVALESRNYKNGVLIGAPFTASTSPAVQSSWNFPRSLELTVDGCITDGNDWSLYELHVWLADEDDPFPVAQDWIDFESGTPATGLSVAPTHSYVAAGTNGAYVGTMQDSAGTMDLVHSQGPTTGARAPIYLGSTTQELNAGTLVVTSRTATLGYTNNELGDIYFIVGPSSLNGTNPTAAQVKAGNNQNGSAALLTHTQTLTTSGAKTYQFTGLTPSQSLRAFAVIEKSPGVFTNVVSWDFVTPRIGIELPAIYAPTNPRTLWASQTAINVKFSASGVSDHTITNGVTNSAGAASFDLSSVSGWNLPEGAPVLVQLRKGNYSFAGEFPLTNLDE